MGVGSGSWRYLAGSDLRQDDSSMIPRFQDEKDNCGSAK
jgi:hypothetical protein